MPPRKIPPRRSAANRERRKFHNPAAARPRHAIQARRPRRRRNSRRARRRPRVSAHVQFAVEFYPYANLSHTIRLRDDDAIARLSDVLRGAPLGVIEATAAVLLGRLYRRRVPHELMHLYRQFSAAPSTERRIRRLRQHRARRPTLPARSARIWRRQLGCFDPGLDLIVLNARLDRPGTPQFVVESILFHEMLHVKHPLRVARCGLEIHSLEFRREEKRFAHYERARRYLKRMR